MSKRAELADRLDAMHRLRFSEPDGLCVDCCPLLEQSAAELRRADRMEKALQATVRYADKGNLSPPQHFELFPRRRPRWWENYARQALQEQDDNE